MLVFRLWYKKELYLNRWIYLIYRLNSYLIFIDFYPSQNKYSNFWLLNIASILIKATYLLHNLIKWPVILAEK